MGGSPVQILIGIKSTRLSPKLIHSLPSGLGIYKSVFYDVNQSNNCFGGPHPIFMSAYRSAGFTANHMDVMFSELARAYLESPRTFMRVDVDDHGPPLEFARELDLIEELNSYLNSPKQLELLLDTPDSSPIDSPIIDKVKYRDSPDKMSQAFTEEFKVLTAPPKDSLFDDVSSDEEYLSCRRVVRFTDPDSTPSLLPLDFEDTAEQLEQPAADMNQTWTCNPDEDKTTPVVEEPYHHPLPSKSESPIYKPPLPLSPIPEVPPK